MSDNDEEEKEEDEEDNGSLAMPRERRNNPNGYRKVNI